MKIASVCWVESPLVEEIDLACDGLAAHVADFEGLGTVSTGTVTTHEGHRPYVLQTDGAVQRVLHLLHLTLQLP